MGFNIKSVNQAEILEHTIKAAMYQKLHETSKKAEWIRLTGVGVGIVSGFLTIAKRIALIFENAIKGLANIFGACCFKQCSFKKGLQQLFYEVPRHIIILPFSIFSAALGLVGKPLKICISPEQYLLNRFNKHDFALKKAGIIAYLDRPADTQPAGV